jgi:hypothetical protein
MEDPATILHKWLRKQHRHALHTRIHTHAHTHTHASNKIAEVSELIRALLSHTSDPIFVHLLIKFGWDVNAGRFGNTYPVNLDALQQALANKSRCFFSQDVLRSLQNVETTREGREGSFVADESVEGDMAAAAELIAGRSFVPQLLLHHASFIINNGLRSLKPHSQFVQGVCLLVDISGFTKLSAAYCAKGSDGIDGLQQATNKYMGRLVEVIYSYEGDIIKFAGDAIICVFLPQDDATTPKGQGSSIGTSPKIRSRSAQLNSFAQMVLGACECALELREVEIDGLTVHVGLSCGEICFGVLGGYENRWECLISGPCIEELSQCLEDAPSRQAVCTPACIKALQQVMSLSPMPYAILYSICYMLLSFYVFCLFILPSHAILSPPSDLGSPCLRICNATCIARITRITRLQDKPRALRTQTQTQTQTQTRPMPPMPPTPPGYTPRSSPPATTLYWIWQIIYQTFPKYPIF